MLYTDETMTKIITLENFKDKRIDIETLKEKLQCSERNAYRIVAKYKKWWPSALIHWLKGKTSNNKTNKRDWLEKYFQLKAFGHLKPTMMAEKIEEKSGYYVPVETIRRKMINLGYWLPRDRKKKVKHKMRIRRTGYWMLVQFDGSYHDWLWTGEIRCLLIAVDDATGDVIAARFWKNERLEDVIVFWEEYFKKNGKPASIYLDRHASYKVNHPQDQFSEEMLTRFKRAMNYLWVEVIYAKSPQGKGRVENKFKMLQDRGIQELKMMGIRDYEKAQEFLDEWIPKVNAKFRVEPKVSWDFHIPMSSEEIEKYERYFAKVTGRTINGAGVVQYNNNKYQVPVGQELAGTNKIRVLETHLGNIQLRSWTILLPYKLISP